jgi:hypothetical protein
MQNMLPTAEQSSAAAAAAAAADIAPLVTALHVFCHGKLFYILGFRYLIVFPKNPGTFLDAESVLHFWVSIEFRFPYFWHRPEKFKITLF